MCGICGMVGRADETLLRKMNEAQRHRGPDGSGVRTFRRAGNCPPAGLGHQRLSIIDLSERAAQPMSYADQRYWITYNGELYNFKALRDELRAVGFTFRSESDTEVLLGMYARYGTAMMSKLKGIFSFAIWDATAGTLFMARDRAGVKPFYYACHRGVFYFASEIKALLPALPPPEMNRSMLPAYLTFLWVPDPHTLFEGISKLPPGCCATYADGEITTEQYWDLRFSETPGRKRLWAKRVRNAISEAVHEQLVSDAPIGSFLSGGIDSSAIVANMMRWLPSVTTYTVGFSAEDLAGEIVPDDLKYAREFANERGLDYHEAVLTADTAELLPKLVWHMDEPVADPAAITTYLICSTASQRLKVILSGVGGDEVFAGYPRHVAARLGRLFDGVPLSIRKRLRDVLDGRLTMGPPGRLKGPRRNAMKFLRGIDRDFQSRYLTYCSYYQDDELAALFSLETRRDTAGVDPFKEHMRHLDRVTNEHWLNQIMYLDFKTFLPCLNLCYTDKMSMAASVEVRVPLLDDGLVNLATQIGPDLKLRGLRRKYVLKRAMDGVLPRGIIRRPKAGFGAPVRSWLDGDLSDMMSELLSPEVIRQRGLFEPDEVAKLIEDNRTGTADNALRIWALLVLELWQRTFLDDGATGTPRSHHRP